MNTASLLIDRPQHPGGCRQPALVTTPPEHCGSSSVASHLHAQCAMHLALWASALAHVRLIFPPSNSASDFLDNSRTPAPCGFSSWVASSAGETVLQSSVPFEVRWHVGYAHHGAHTLQIVNTSAQISSSEVLADLVIGLTLADVTLQTAIVTIPRGLNCTHGANCALRLKRTALEWGSDFFFWSCSRIVVHDDEVGATSLLVPENSSAIVEPKGEPSAEAVPEAAAEPSNMTSAEPEGEPSAEAVPEAAAEPSDATNGTSSDPGSEPQSEPEPENDGLAVCPSERSTSAHPMDGQDMMVMLARGDYFRVQDSYTPSRATPRPDAAWALAAAAGTDDVLDAIGWEDGESHRIAVHGTFEPNALLYSFMSLRNLTFPVSLLIPLRR